MANNIEIKVQDKVSPTISRKLEVIATNARSADAALVNLRTQLASLNSGALTVILASANSATRALQNTTLAAQRLATEQQRTAAAASAAAAAQARATTAALQSTIAQQNLAAATLRVQLAQQQAANAAQRLATEQARTAAAAAQAQAASDRAALAALRLQQAQDRAAASSQRASNSLAGFVRVAALLTAGGLSAGAIIGMSDAYTVLQNKLQNVTTSQEQVNKLTDEMFVLANKTLAGVQETATAFTRFDRSLKSMGKSQEETLRMTETVNKALANSGATASEASSALLQLSQGFNAGRLMGDEFRAVSENMPVVLDAVAKALNVPINRVKQLSTEGKITSKVLFDAFKLIQDQVDETFKKTTPTIAQSLTVLKNESIQFFGELNKAVGFTAALSQTMLWLGRNLDIVASAVAVLGVALLVAFGPALIGMLTAATSAVWAFTVAIATNPIGLLLVGITAATVAIVAFGDKIAVSADGLTTLKDVARATWYFIEDGIIVVSDTLESVWSAAIDIANAKTNGWAEQYRSIGETVMKLTKAYGNLVIGVWYAAYNAIKVVWNNFPALMKALFGAVVNLAADAVENFINLWQQGFSIIAKLAEGVAPDLSKSINETLEKTRIKLPRLEVAGEAKNAANELQQVFKDALTTDFIGNAGKAIMDRAAKISAERRAAAAAAANTELRGAGVSTMGDDPNSKGAKAAMSRALSLEKINTQLDNEIDRMFKLQPLREAQAKFDQIEEGLITKKIKLTDEEKTSIMAKIQAVQKATDVQRQFDAIYNDTLGPLKEYNATQEAANKLLSMGAISQDQYSRAVLKSSESFANSSDPMRQYNKDLKQQSDLLNLLPKQRQVEQQIMQVQNDLLAKGRTLSDAQLIQLREKLTLLQQLNAVSQQEASLLDSSVGKRQAEIDHLTAINKLLADRQSGFTKSDAMNAIGATKVGAYLEDSPEMMNAKVEELGLMYNQIDELRAADLISEQTASAAKMKIWNDQQNVMLTKAQTFFGALEGLQSSSNAKMARIGKAAAIANAIVNTYQSATGAYASLASIPYVGPALGAAAAAAAIAAGMANVAQIRSQSANGFKEGGYTGSIGANEVAGVVHGNEYVMDANTTARIGVANLEALRSGAATVQQNASNAPANAVMAPPAGNSPANVGNSTNLRMINVLDPALIGDFLATPEGEQVFVNTIRRNSDVVKQALSNG